MDPAQIVSSLLAYAMPIGLGLLLSTALTRVLRRGVGTVLVVVGLASSLYFAYSDWPLGHDLLTLSRTLLFAAVVIGLGVWSLRRPAPLLELAVIMAAWYLIFREAMGPDFLATLAGPLAWAAAVLLTMIVTEPRGRPEEVRARIETRDVEPPTAVS